jgi:dTDP-4-dehydrorhamnose 3,5-epimerase
MPFKVKRANIPDILIIIPDIFKDERGFFLEFYKYSDFTSFGIDEYFVQDNYSRSTYGVLRGLHYQKNPYAQGKLVKCIKGKIYDVAVDIRKNSNTYGKWFGTELSEDNNIILYIPTGFAHGFVVLSDTADVLYKCTEEYSPENDRGIIWNDPDINIKWPITNPIISSKDMKNPRLNEADNNF